MQIAKMTLGDYNAKYPANSSRGKFHSVRIHARKVMKDNNVPYSCKVCGYATYVEACHVKAIADFPHETLVEEVNSLKNLVFLCPNHHKEFDRGITSFDFSNGSHK